MAYEEFYDAVENLNQYQAQNLLHRMRVCDFDAFNEFAKLIPKEKYTSEDRGLNTMIEILYQTDLNESDVGLICELTKRLYRDEDMEDQAHLLGMVGAIEGAARVALYFKNQPGFAIENLDRELTPEVASKISRLENPQVQIDQMQSLYSEKKDIYFTKKSITTYQSELDSLSSYYESHIKLTNDLITLIALDPHREGEQIWDLSKRIAQQIKNLDLDTPKASIVQRLMTLLKDTVTYLRNKEQYYINKHTELSEKYSGVVNALQEKGHDIDEDEFYDTRPGPERG